MKISTQLAFDSIANDKARVRVLDSKARQEMIEFMGRLAQILSLPRSTGQIYGLLYFSLSPLSLMDICGAVGISKASTSTGTRQLASWGAIRKVWVPGERRDFFEAVEDFSQLLDGSYKTIIKPRIGSSKKRLKQIEVSLNSDLKTNFLTKKEYKFMNFRLNKIINLHNKMTKFLPVLEKLF